MTPPTAFLLGLVLGAALCVPAGPAYHRVLARRGSGAWFAAWRGAGPVLLRDLLPYALAALLAGFLAPPAERAWRIVGAMPLLVWFLWRGWTVVELPAAASFLHEDVRSDVALQRFLPLRPAGLAGIVALALVLLPLGFVLAGCGFLGTPAFLVGYAAAFLGMHWGLAVDQNRRAPRERGPYVIAPATGRLLLAGSGLVLFAAVIYLVGVGGLLGLGATQG